MSRARSSCLAARSGSSSECALQLVADDGSTRQIITKPMRFQAKILAAFGVDTGTWQSRLTG
jgi:hypothetical protein